MKHLKIIGNGEAFSATNGNTSFLLAADTTDLNKGNHILIDCGYQIPQRLWLENDHDALDLILLTHFHADHAFGVVPLLVRYLEEKRTRPLHIWGPEGVEKFVYDILELGYPGVARFFKYSLEFKEMKPLDDMYFVDVRIRCAPTIHSIPNLMYRLDFETGSFSVSGDGKLTDQAFELIKDVGIHFQETYELEDRIPSHCSFEEVLRLHQANQAQSIGITHIARHAIAPMEKAFAQYITDKQFVTDRQFVTDKQHVTDNKVNGSLFMTHPGQRFNF